MNLLNDKNNKKKHVFQINFIFLKYIQCIIGIYNNLYLLFINY